MNNDPTDLERELRRLQPLPPDSRLVSRLAGILDRPEVHPQKSVSTWWQWLGFNRPAAALGWGLLSPIVAACVAVMVAEQWKTSALIPSPSAPSAVPTGEMASAHATQAVNVLYQALDEGVVAQNGQEPMRRVRYRSADRVRWHNPQSGAQWEVSYPREDVLLIPVQAE